LGTAGVKEYIKQLREAKLHGYSVANGKLSDAKTIYKNLKEVDNLVKRFEYL
jgi:hypothetical protein